MQAEKARISAAYTQALYQKLFVHSIQGERPDMETRTGLTNSLLDHLDALPKDDPDREEYEASVVQTLGKFGDNKRGKEFIYKALGDKRKQIQDRAVWAVIDIQDVLAQEKWEKVESLHADGKLSADLRRFALSHIDPAKAAPLLKQELAATQDKKEALRIARHLQFTQDPAGMHDILLKAKEMNWQSSINWSKDDLGRISDQALGSYLGIAPDEDLPLTLEFAIKVPCLPYQCLKPILDRRLLSHPDPKVRILVAQWIGRMTGEPVIQPPESARPWINAQLSVERDPEVINALKGAGDQITKGQKIWEMLQEHRREADRANQQAK
jgi:hypothetical protein